MDSRGRLKRVSHTEDMDSRETKDIDSGEPPKDGEIALSPSTNGAISCFLVLPSSELPSTEITEYKYLVL